MTGFFLWRLYSLQILDGDFYRAKSEYETFSSVEPLFDRGTIYFENKDSSLASVAVVRSGYTLGIQPKLIKDIEETYKKISSIFSIEKEDFMTKAVLKDDPYEEIARRLSPEDARKIESLDLTGVSLVKEQWRIYPRDSLSAHIIGFVGYNEENKIDGRYGLERYYEDSLRRLAVPSGRNFFAETVSKAKKLSFGEEKLEADIVASVEPAVSKKLEEELKKINDTYGSNQTGGIIMNPKTGEIFAASAVPSFDPNKYNLEKEVSVFSNPLVESVFEMGSIMKPITMAVGLDLGLVTASTTYKDEGSVKVGDRTIYNFDKKARGTVSMQEVLNQSLNTGSTYVALGVGKKKYYEYISNFGLGEETGIDLPSEAGGKLQNLAKGNEVELANASFGQGISTTPVAMARALSALANGGVLPNPHIVKKIDYRLGIGRKIEVTEEEMRRVIKPETSEEITRMLVNVVDKALKQGAVKMEHYSIAAKTGTAQIAEKGGRGYYPDRFLHSFFGYFPAYEPQFLIFLYTLEPKEDYASNTLTLPFMDITKFLINYYQIPPDR